MEETMEKKDIKRVSNKIGISLLVYFLLNFLVVLVGIVVEMVAFMLINGYTNAADKSEETAIENAAMEYIEQSGLSMTAGVFVGILFLFLIFGRKGGIKALVKKNKTMNTKSLLQLICVFMGIQMVGSLSYVLLESGLNLIGLSAETNMEDASSVSQTISMFIYCGIVAPLVEEIIYRGFILRALEKHGKVLAIVISAFLFGIMHCNVPQSIFAMLVGIVLGYIAMEYSIKWSIFLHVLNNMFFGDLLSMALSGLSQETQNTITSVIMGGFFVIGLIIMIMKRKQIKAYIMENKVEKKYLLWTMTTVGMIIFVASQIGLAVFLLERL